MSDDLAGRIWAAASRDADRVIVRDRARAWSWSALLRRADAYAQALGAVTAPPIVPLLCGRNGDTVAAVLGCLMARRAFAPLSPDQPAERLRSCFATLGAACFIDTLDGVAPEAVSGFTRVTPATPSSSGLPDAPRLAAGDLVYVLFTSGSTGAPKGVMVSYGNLANTIAWSSELLPWRDDDVIGIVVNFFFDIAMFDLFVGLSSNVPLAILSRPGDVIAAAGEISASGVTSVFSAPSFLSQFVRTNMLGDGRLSSLRRIISGGDFFPPSHVLEWMKRRPDVEIYNVWGPTETSIVNTMHLVADADRRDLEQGRHAPVGRSHPRMPLMIVDEALQRVPDGKAGEICMLGACVTQGYLHDDARTAAAYVTIDGQRAYRTQDLGVIGADGLLRVLGRLGSMVKVNGYRVDLSEVEGAATAIPTVHRAVAFVREPEPGLHELWLALEPRDRDSALDIFATKQALRAHLPVYMVPKRLIVLPDLPLTPNGKLDRRAAAERAAAAASAS